MADSGIAPNLRIWTLSKSDAHDWNFIARRLIISTDLPDLITFKLRRRKPKWIPKPRRQTLPPTSRRLYFRPQRIVQKELDPSPLATILLQKLLNPVDNNIFNELQVIMLLALLAAPLVALPCSQLSTTS